MRIGNLIINQFECNVYQNILVVNVHVSRLTGNKTNTGQEETDFSGWKTKAFPEITKITKFSIFKWMAIYRALAKCLYWENGRFIFQKI